MHVIENQSKRAVALFELSRSLADDAFQIHVDALEVVRALAHLCREAGLEPVTLLAQGGSVLTLCQVLNFLAYGILGRAGAPLYAALDLAATVGDRLAPNQLFCHNFACLARRAEPAAEVVAA